MYDLTDCQHSPDVKNSPEMNELERDLIPVKILAKNIQKQKSYSIII